MDHRTSRLALGAGLALVLTATLAVAADKNGSAKEGLHLTAPQKDYLWLEPMLVTVRLDAKGVDDLPAAPATGKGGTLRFEVEPALQPRKGAKPLPTEARVAAKARTRRYDLTEWFAFPDKGGTFTVRAVVEHDGTTLTSAPLTVTLRKPAKGDAEHEPMARIHHTPWSNYDTSAFCGDCFDVVKRWPQSRFVKYSHYWNGRFQQNKKEYAKAIDSYRALVEKYPGCVLADDAALGIVECLAAQKKLPEAQEANAALLRRLADRDAKSGTGPTAVRVLAEEIARRIKQDLGTK